LGSAQQIIEAFPEDRTQRFMVRDRANLRRIFQSESIKPVFRGLPAEQLGDPEFEIDAADVPLLCISVVV